MMRQPGQWPCKATNPDGEQCVLVVNHPGGHMTAAVAMAAKDAAGPDRVLVFSYPGRTQPDAGARFQAHAQQLAQDGYSPVSQSWGEGRPGIGRVMALGGDAATAMRPKGFSPSPTSFARRYRRPHPPHRHRIRSNS